MKTINRAVAAAEVLLIFPSALFMTALFVRNVTPVQNEPAHTAQQIVQWYVSLGPRVALWGLLTALPLAVLVIGGATLLHRWQQDVHLRQAACQTVTAIRVHLAIVIVAGATAMAGAVLAFVAVHMLTD